MAACPAVSTHDPETGIIITKDNVNELIPDKFETTPGTVVRVRCSPGLFLNGQEVFSCGDNGSWSYDTKPYCTTTDPNAGGGDDGLDTNTKIMIGVVCGVAGIIIIILLVMICITWYRDRKRREERHRFWERMANADRHDGPPGYRGRDGPSTIDVEMYNRGGPAPPSLPPPYDYREGRYEKKRPYAESERMPYRSRGRDYERETSLSNRMYLPDRDRDRDFSSRDYNSIANTRKSRDLRDDDYDDPPYVRDWVSRSSRMRPDDYDRPSVHGRRSSRDPYIWRNA